GDERRGHRPARRSRHADVPVQRARAAARHVPRERLREGTCGVRGDQLAVPGGDAPRRSGEGDPRLVLPGQQLADQLRGEPGAEVGDPRLGRMTSGRNEMDASPLVSVVIPAYNVSGYIA